MKRSRRDPRYLAILALVAAAILLLGNLLRPGRNAEQGSARRLSAQSALSQLPRLTQRRSIEDHVEFVRLLVANRNPYIYRLNSAGQSAVLWNAATLVTARTNGPMTSPESATGSAPAPLEASAATAGPHLPLAILTTSMERPPLRLERVAAGFSQGSWMLALWRSADGSPAWSEGQYLQTRRTNCGDLMPAQTLASTIELSPKMAGAGVFSLDGALIGVVGRCDGGLAILGVQAIELLSGRGNSLDDRLLERYGLRIGLPDDGEHAALRIRQGLLVREVWKGYQAYASGLRPGDVILGVDGAELTSAVDLQRLVLPVAQEVFDLQVTAHGRRRSVALRARPEVETDFSSAGVLLAAEEPGVVIAKVASESPFAALGAQQGDRLLALDGRPFDDAAAASRYLERAAGSVWATVGREERVWGALISDE